MAAIRQLVVYWIVFVSSNIHGVDVQSARVSCSFDDGLCNWTNGDPQFLWRNNSGQTDDRTSGPLNDHTCRNYKGQYIFISGSDVYSKGRSAVVQSPNISLANNASLTFWYNMNGLGIGSLSCLRVNTDTNGTDGVLWRREGRQGHGWLNTTVAINAGQFRVEFVATARLPYSSDLALDDIQLSSEIPDLDKAHCILPPTTTVKTTTTTHRPSTTSVSTSTAHVQQCLHTATPLLQLPGSCDFENGLCLNKIISSTGNSRVTWIRQNTPEGYNNRGIPDDHTFHKNTGTKGFFVRFRNNRFFQKNGASASIETPPIYANYTCVTFWYNMPSNYSNLKVSVRHGDVSKEAWRRDTTFSGFYTGWHQALFSLYEDVPFTLVFEAYDKKHLNTVGIDDISIMGANIIDVEVISTFTGVKTTPQHTPSSDKTSKLPTASTITFSSHHSQAVSPASLATSSKPFTSTIETSTKPFTGTTSTKPFTGTTSTKPFTGTTSTKPFTDTTSTKPFTGTTSTKPFTGTTSTKPFTGTTSTKPFTDTTSTKPFTGTTSTKPFTGTTSTKPFTGIIHASTKPVSPSTTCTHTSPSIESTTASPTEMTLEPFSASPSTSSTESPTALHSVTTLQATGALNTSKIQMTGHLKPTPNEVVTDTVIRKHDVTERKHNTHPTAESKFHHSSTIAGSVVGGLVVIVLAGIVGYVMYTRSRGRKQARKRKQTPTHNSTKAYVNTISKDSDFEELQSVHNEGNASETIHSKGIGNLNGTATYIGQNKSNYTSYIQQTNIAATHL